MGANFQILAQVSAVIWNAIVSIANEIYKKFNFRLEEENVFQYQVCRAFY